MEDPGEEEEAEERPRRWPATCEPEVEDDRRGENVEIRRHRYKLGSNIR